MRDDYLENLFNRFVTERQKSVQGLFSKFKGLYRAHVVETNDPLNFRRVRIKIPELHDYNLPERECPWAIQMNWFGGQQCGSFCNYVIDDVVFVLFETNHPYSPIIIGSADATRRARYPIDSVYHHPSPAALTEMADIDEIPVDYEQPWLPKDKRPMSLGMKDRYGNCFLINSVGFFPDEHKEDPADPGMDLVNKRDIEFQKGTPPQKNDPDTKYMVMYSKYGNFIMLNDVGYDWKKEFEGKWIEDRDKERDRTKYYVKHFTEQVPTDRDQRRIEMRTRCGHFYEMRDVGWITARGGDPWVAGPLKDHSQSGFDERWMKLRSKGSHLVQIMDAGFDEKNDNYYKTLNKDQFGGNVDSEEEFWQNQDARQIRLITRHGFKLTLDDRGSDPIQAEVDDVPHGNGLLIKGKRKAGGVKRGYGIEFNEKDDMDKLAIYTPRSQVFEMNDRYKYVVLCTATRNPISEPWQWKKDNEFARTPVRQFEPEQDTFHLVLDDFNEYARLKTPGQQGVEFRDGGLDPGFDCDKDPDEASGGASKSGFQGIRHFAGGNKCRHQTWGIIEDHEKRALFMTYDEKAIVMHSTECGPTNCTKPIPAMWLIFDEKGEGASGIWTKHTEPNTIIMQNLCNKIKVFAVNDIEFYTLKNFRVKAHENIEFRSLQDIVWRADRDVLGSSDRVTHHWSGDDYKVKSKKNIYEHAVQRIANYAEQNHCIEAEGQATAWSKSNPHVTQGPNAEWVVGPGRVGTQATIHAPMIQAINGPGEQAHVSSGSSRGDHLVGTASSHTGTPISAERVPHPVRITPSDNLYLRPDEQRFIVCGRKHAGNKPFETAPLSSIRGNPGPPATDAGDGSGDSPSPAPAAPAEQSQQQAEQSQEDAQQGQQDAEKAQEAAQEAETQGDQEKAEKAKEEAEKAQEKAQEEQEKSEESQEEASKSQEAAQEAADDASEEASEAQKSAKQAQEEANQAQRKATRDQSTATSLQQQANTPESLQSAIQAQKTATQSQAAAIQAQKKATEAQKKASEIIDQTIQRPSSLPTGPGNPSTPGYSGGDTDIPEPPPPGPPAEDPPAAPDPTETIKTYHAIGFANNTNDYSNWEEARLVCDTSLITESNFGGLQISDLVVVARGGYSINTAGIETLELDILTRKESAKDIVFNVIYSYSPPTVGSDFNFWYSIGEIDSRINRWRIDVSKLIGPALGGPIYFAVVAKSDRFMRSWPKIIKGAPEESWFCLPAFRFIINGKPTDGEQL